MFHLNTEKVIADWTARRGVRRAPARADISPAAFRDLLPQIFILGRSDDGEESFRLAGGLLVDLHGRDLRNVDFFSLWPRLDSEAIRQALEEARDASVPLVVRARGWTASGDDAHLEIVLAPLTGPSGEMDRILGLYQPLSSLRRLMGAHVVSLTVEDLSFAEREGLSGFAPLRAARTHLRLAAVDGVRLD